jgi:hypothetical protein
MPRALRWAAYSTAEAMQNLSVVLGNADEVIRHIDGFLEAYKKQGYADLTIKVNKVDTIIGAIAEALGVALDSEKLKELSNKLERDINIDVRVKLPEKVAIVPTPPKK